MDVAAHINAAFYLLSRRPEHVSAFSFPSRSCRQQPAQRKAARMLRLRFDGQLEIQGENIIGPNRFRFHAAVDYPGRLPRGFCQHSLVDKSAPHTVGNRHNQPLVRVGGNHTAIWIRLTSRWPRKKRRLLVWVQRKEKCAWLSPHVVVPRRTSPPPRFRSKQFHVRPAPPGIPEPATRVLFFYLFAPTAPLRRSSWRSSRCEHGSERAVHARGTAAVSRSWPTKALSHRLWPPTHPKSTVRARGKLCNVHVHISTGNLLCGWLSRLRWR